jgi:hypothetical protein
MSLNRVNSTLTTKKLTTNEKLDSIINGPEDEIDDTQDYLRKERRAKKHLQRARLYGCGARAKIPKIKTIDTKKTQSPFQITVLSTTENFLEPQRETSAVPPGSHSDLYRMVYNSHHDPFYTTTSMTEGIRVMSQPPWYYGNNNKTIPSDNSLLASANRYGYRGAREILQKTCTPYDTPLRTLHTHSPDFLRKQQYTVHEYVPRIIGSPIQTVNNMESPKLWPENSMYAFGSPLKKPPTSSVYRKETTVGDRSRPIPSKSLQQVFQKHSEEINILSDYGKLESNGMFLSKPMTAQLEFETKWNDRVLKTANSTLRATLHRDIPPCEKHGLMDTSDSIRSSLGGSMSMIVHSQSSQEFQFRYRIQQKQSTTPYSKVYYLYLINIHILYLYLYIFYIL